MCIGLATGSTPLPVYARLAALLKDADLSRVHTFNLDEYEGLPASHPQASHLEEAVPWDRPTFTRAHQSYRYYMHDVLFRHLPGLPSENVHFPEAGTDYDALIARHGGIDVQLLGIGTNGHIGFNEPGSEVGRECWLPSPLDHLCSATLSRAALSCLPRRGRPIHASSRVILARRRRT